MSKQILPPHGNTLFPWHKWANCKPHIVHHGQHFQSKPEMFRRTLFMHARRNGLDVTTRVSGDTVWFQFSRKESA